MEIDELANKAQARLMAISAIITFVYHSGVKINEISIASTKLIFSNQNAILDLLWAFWAFYTIRATQYLYEIGSFEFKISLQKVMENNFSPIIMGITKDEYLDILDSDKSKISKLTVRLVIFPTQYLHKDGRIYRNNVKSSKKKSEGTSKKSNKKFPLINLINHRFQKRSIINRIRFEFMFLIFTRFSVGIQIVARIKREGGLGSEINEIMYLGVGGILTYIKCVVIGIMLRKKFFESYFPLIAGIIPVLYVSIIRKWNFHI